ncbi:hypothetical protein NMY22_g16279 [Coprinellus aureogranulatus]|nr:hypothetical protein NMY22_g16279 [Coprinellus aureogranulatus]
MPDRWFYSGEVDAFLPVFPSLDTLTVSITDMRNKGATVLRALSSGGDEPRFTVSVEADIPGWPFDIVKWMAEQRVAEQFPCVSGIKVILNGPLAMPGDGAEGREVVKAWFAQFPATREVKIYWNEAPGEPVRATRFAEFFSKAIPEVLQRARCVEVKGGMTVGKILEDKEILDGADTSARGRQVSYSYLGRETE